jgi:Spirocyclase AveC-like
VSKNRHINNIRPQSEPGMLFAILGLAILFVIASTLATWVTGPDFHPAPTGNDVPPYLLIFIIRLFEAFAFAMCAGWLWFVVIRPWRRTGELSWDGMLTFAFLSMWIQDPMCNYFNFTFAYNGYLTNMGSWSASIPGWQSPRGGNLPEPLFLIGGVYFWFCTLNAIAFSWALGRLRSRFPQLSMLTIVPLAFMTLVVLDLLLQIPATRLGLFAYPGAVAELTFWAGQPYQFPIYGDLLINVVFMAVGLLRFYRNDKGLSLAERGIERLNVKPALQKFLRTLALVAVCNICYFCFYFMPYAWFAMSADAFPRYPSYMLSECRAGTQMQ